MNQIRQKLSLASTAASIAILNVLSPVWAQGFGGSAPANINITAPQGGVKNFGALLSAGIRAAIIIAAILTFAYLIWGGIQWITSGGDKAKYEEARNRITAALVGLAIVAAAWALMALIGYFFDVEPFNLQINSVKDFQDGGGGSGGGGGGGFTYTV